MPNKEMTRPVFVRARMGPRKVKDTIKPYTKINVKPYVAIMREGAVLCGGDDKIPLIFDNKELAVGFAAINEFNDCEFKTMSLEELIRMCRSPKVRFDSFYLIDHKSQIA